MAISVSTLGAAQNKAGTSPWTALTALSISADDRVVVAHAGDADASAISAEAIYPDKITAGTATQAVWGTLWSGQNFITTVGFPIGTINLRLSKTGSPSGNLNVDIYAADGDHKPTGGLLSSGSIATSALSGVADYAISLTSYTFSNATDYCIIVSVPSGDNANYIIWYKNSSGVEADWYSGTSNNSGSTWSWANQTEHRFYFGDSFSLTRDVVATNAGNVVTSIWSGIAPVTATIWEIIVTNTSTAKAMTAYKSSGLADPAIDKTASATGLSTTPSSGVTATLTQADELIIGAIGVEDEIDDMTGTWVTGAGNVSGNEQGTGTNGGGDASNVYIESAAEIVSATTAQTAAMTGIDNTDWAAAIATYKGVVAGGVDYPISTSPGLTAAATVAYAAAWDRGMSPGLTVLATIARKLAYDRATSPGLTVAVTIVKAFGRLITTTANLTVSATVARAVAYKKAMTADLTAAVTVVKGWGRAITTSPGLTLSTTVAKSFGKKITTVANLSAAVSRWVSPTGHNDPDTAWTDEANAYDDDTGTYAFATLTSSWGSFLELTIAPILANGLRYWVLTQNGLHSSEIDIDVFDSDDAQWEHILEVAITGIIDFIEVSFTKRTVTKIRMRFRSTAGTPTQARVNEIDFLQLGINKTIAYKRAALPGLTASATVVKSWGRIITTSTNLAVSTTISRIVAYARATATGLTISITIVVTFVGGVTNYLITVVANLTASTTISRIVAYKRAISAVNLVISAVIASVVKGFVVAITTNLTVSVIINYCAVLRELLRVPIDALDTMRMSISRMAITRISTARKEIARRIRSCYGSDV